MAIMLLYIIVKKNKTDLPVQMNWYLLCILLNFAPTLLLSERMKANFINISGFFLENFSVFQHKMTYIHIQVITTYPYICDYIKNTHSPIKSCLTPHENGFSHRVNSCEVRKLGKTCIHTCIHIHKKKLACWYACTSCIFLDTQRTYINAPFKISCHFDKYFNESHSYFWSYLFKILSFISLHTGVVIYINLNL